VNMQRLQLALPLRARRPSAHGTNRTATWRRRAAAFAVVAVATLGAWPVLASAQTASTSEKAAVRDGAQDFEWMIGNWKGSLRRLQKPLTGSTTWVEYEVTQVTRKLFDGRANVDEFTAVRPGTNERVEGLTVRLYNPESRAWSIYWANMRNGLLALPPTVGRFADGRGEFYDNEEFEGRPIVVRYVWSEITPTSARFEQSFSADGGKSWEPNWICTITRVKE
jgi:hypothetical protein